MSRRQENVNRPIRDPIPRPGAVGHHVRRCGMRFQRLDALPLLDHHERIRTGRGLELEHRAGIDGGRIFDASLLGQHGGHVRSKRFQHGIALPRLGGDDGDDVDHFYWRLLMPHPATPHPLQSTKKLQRFCRVRFRDSLELTPLSARAEQCQGVKIKLLSAANRGFTLFPKLGPDGALAAFAQLSNSLF